jgi:protein-tyrosine phosphatase
MVVNSYPKNRVIPFEGINNFRDMGGYETADGRKVKFGIFFRSAELTGITEQDTVLFQSLGIRCIFDYRDDSEAIAKPDPILPNIKNERIPAIQSQTVPTNNTIEELLTSDYFKQMNEDVLVELYSQLVINNPSYKRLMNLIQDPSNLGLLHHCAAGKDRTGVGAALILLALGVPKETVVEDYLITNETLKDFNEKLFTKLSGQLDQIDMLKLQGLMGAKEEFMMAVFKSIEDNYGDFDSFFTKEFDLTPEKRAKLQEFCLE